MIYKMVDVCGDCFRKFADISIEKRNELIKRTSFQGVKEEAFIEEVKLGENNVKIIKDSILKLDDNNPAVIGLFLLGILEIIVGIYLATKLGGVYAFVGVIPGAFFFILGIIIGEWRISRAAMLRAQLEILE